jgi:hypothetical protein
VRGIATELLAPVCSRWSLQIDHRPNRNAKVTLPEVLADNEGLLAHLEQMVRPVRPVLPDPVAPAASLGPPDHHRPLVLLEEEALLVLPEDLSSETPSILADLPRP